MLLDRLRRRPLSRGADDRGFTLVEAVVALMIATISFTALAAAGVSAMRGTMIARTNQQSADLVAKAVESVRTYDYTSAAHDPADATLSKNSAIQSCSGSKCYDPGTGTKENLAFETGGLVNPHRETLSRTSKNNYVDYTISTYVTTPVDTTGADYRRVTVTVDFSLYGKTHTRTMSTIITYNERGLPLPVYKVTTVGASTMTVNPSGTVYFGFTVNNQGAPDRFSVAPGGSDAWEFYVDNGDGVWDPADDTTLMTDTDADGTLDTGRLDPSSSVTFWMVRTVGAATGSTTTEITFTSVAQPTADTAVVTQSITTVVQNGVITPTVTATPSTSTSSAPSPTPTGADCTLAGTAPTAAAATGYSLRQYSLHNYNGTTGAGVDSAAQSLLTMDLSAPVPTTLYQYSTDLATATPGRVLNSGGSFSSGAASTLVDWRYPVGKKSWSGTATLNLWVASVPSAPTTNVSLAADIYKYVRVGNTYTATSIGSIPLSISSFTCAGFQQVAGSVSVSQAQLGANDQLGLRIYNSGTSAVRLAYGVAGTYPSALVIPEK